MKLKDYQQQWVDELRDRCPLGVPVTVEARRPRHKAPHKNTYTRAITLKTPRGYVIRVLPSDCDVCFQDDLLHEWAHIMSCCVKPRQAHKHGDLWGQMYARAYRALLQVQ